MYAVVLTGRMLPGCSPDEVWEAVAAKFNLGVDVLKSRVLHRAPVTIRELADFDQAQRMQAMLMHCGAEADLVPTDGVRWQLKDGSGQKGPVPREFLRVARARRMLSGDELVRRSVDAEWLPLESVGDSVSSPADAGPVADARRGVLPPPLPESRPAMSNLGAASSGRHMPPPLPLSPITPSSPEASDAKSKWGWVAGALLLLAFVARMLRTYQSNGLGGVFSKLWPILLSVGALVVLIVMHERLMKNLTFSRWWSVIVRAPSPATSEGVEITALSARKADCVDLGQGGAPQRNGRQTNSFATSSGVGRRVIAAALLLLLGAGGLYLFDAANEALGISCNDQEVVDTAKSVLYRALGPKMGAVSGGFGLPMPEETVRKVVSLEFMGIGTMRREGNVLQCLAILKAAQPPSAEGDLTAFYRGLLIADLDDKPIRYNVIKADDGQHFTVTMSQQE